MILSGYSSLNHDNNNIDANNNNNGNDNNDISNIYSNNNNDIYTNDNWSDYTDLILEMSSVPRPEPVPPPREWVSWKPWIDW